MDYVFWGVLLLMWTLVVYLLGVSVGSEREHQANLAKLRELHNRRFKDQSDEDS